MIKTAATLPAMVAPSVRVDRNPELFAAMCFLEGASVWSGDDLETWIDEYVVAPGYMKRPSRVHEAVVGEVKLGGAGPSKSGEVTKLVLMARSRVVVTLRGFIASPPDDRFLQAAIFGGRVRREQRAGATVWTACPGDAATLSEIVLSLVAADLLGRRDFYEQSLCVCDVCGRVSFAKGSPTRRECAEHPARGESTSGFQKQNTTLSFESPAPGPDPDPTDEG